MFTFVLHDHGVKLYIETFYLFENNTMPSDFNSKWLLRKYIVTSFIIFMLNINKSFTAWEELPLAMRNILYFLTCLCTLDFGRSIEVHIKNETSKTAMNISVHSFSWEWFYNF